MLVFTMFWSLSRLWKRVAWILLLRWFNDGFRQAALLLWFLLTTRSVRILDTIECSRTLLWLFPRNPSYLGTHHWPYWFRNNIGVVVPELLFQALCLSIFNLSPTENICLFIYGNLNKASLSVCSRLWLHCLHTWYFIAQIKSKHQL